MERAGSMEIANVILRVMNCAAGAYVYLLILTFRKWKILIWAGITSLLVFQGTVLYQIVMAHPVLVTILQMGVLVIALSLLGENPIWTVIKAVILWNLLLSLGGETITYAFLRLLHYLRGENMMTWNMHTYLSESLILVRVISNSVVVILAVLTVTIWRLRTNRAEKDVNVFLPLLTVPVMQTFFIVFLLSVSIRFQNVTMILGILLSGLSLLSGYLILRMEEDILKLKDIRKRMEELYLRRQGEWNIRRQVLHYRKCMEAIQHDYCNILETFRKEIKSGGSCFLVRNRMEEEKNILEKIKIRKYCDHPVINSIFSVKKDLAEEKGIYVDIKAEVPESMGIFSLNLCSLFCNLIDNAIEECERIEGYMERWVCIRAGERGGFLIIKVSNPTANTDKKGWITEKKEKELHGLGLTLVKKIVRQHDGRLEMERKNGVVTVIAALKVSASER